MCCLLPWELSNNCSIYDWFSFNVGGDEDMGSDEVEDEVDEFDKYFDDGTDLFVFSLGSTSKLQRPEL